MQSEIPIPLDEIKIVEPTVDAPVADYMEFIKEETASARDSLGAVEDLKILGKYVHPGFKRSPEKGSHLILIGELDLKEKMTHLDSLAEANFPSNISKFVTEFVGDLKINLGKVLESPEDLATLEKEYRTALHAHENTHRDQKIRFSDTSDVDMLGFLKDNVESLGRVDYLAIANPVLQSLASQETQSRLAQFTTKGAQGSVPENLDLASEISIRGNTTIAKIEFSNALWFLEDRQNQGYDDSLSYLVNLGRNQREIGILNTIDPTMFADLSILSRRPNLLRELAEGTVEAADLRESIVSSLKLLKDSPEDFAALLESKDFKFTVDHLLMASIEEATSAYDIAKGKLNSKE